MYNIYKKLCVFERIKQKSIILKIIFKFLLTYTKLSFNMGDVE